MLCAQPIYLTNSGSPKEYLRGIAIKSNNRHETPSRTAIVRNMFNIIRYNHLYIIKQKYLPFNIQMYFIVSIRHNSPVK